MSRRAILKQQLCEAWTAAIQRDYHRQRINSERSLQASLWSQLNSILSPKSRRMFIEPTLTATSPNIENQLTRESRIPDLVICNTKEVIGVVEIKYIPRVRPNWRKDLDTFSWINKHRDQFAIRNKRHRGVANDDRKYRLSKDVLFVWAGVHSEEDVDLSQHIDHELAKHFLEMHAVTRAGKDPVLKCQ